MDLNDIQSYIDRIHELPVNEQREILQYLERLEAVKSKASAKTSFIAFVKTVWPQFVEGYHHKIMADAFERVMRGELKRLIINMAPRHRLALDTPIPTTKGWKTVSEITPGDRVFSPCGDPVLVTGKSKVYDEELYEVTAVDGSTIRCDGEHLWTVRFGSRCGFHTYNTAQLYGRQNGDCLVTKRGGGVCVRGQTSGERRPPLLPVNEAIKTPKKNFLIDPYLLGLWLGDGTRHCGVITAHPDDEAFYRPMIEALCYKTTDQKTPYTFGVLGLKVQLRELGVLNNKHIPDEYLFGSIEQRIALVQGLMDSDGCVSKAGQCFFSQKDRALIDQFRSLLNSLGVKNTLQLSEAKIGDVSYGVTHKVSFYMRDCVRLPRKRVRTKAPHTKNLARSIRIEKLPIRGPVQCIQVANDDGLFLMGSGWLVGHNTKSEFGSHLFPAWYLGHHPTKYVVQASNTSELAVDFGRKVRDTISDKEYQKIFPDTQIHKDVAAAGKWKTTKKGEYFAIGVGGTLTGRGGDLIILDDVHSEQQARQAESKPEIYDDVYNWYTSGPRQRVQPGAAIVIIMTRWSKRDLTGRVVKAQLQSEGEFNDEWEVIELPAILPSGKPIWPEYWPEKEILAIKEELPISKWMAQYQQTPTAEEGALVKREWWKRWPREEPEPKVEFIIQSWDTAFEKTQRADYSACTTWGVFYKEDEDTGKKGANLILLDAYRKRLEFPALKKQAKELYKKWDPETLIVEKRASGAPLIYELREAGIMVSEFTPSRGNDKIARVNAVSDLFASGVIWAPEFRWADEVIEEFAEFPAGEHDDYVDSSTQALLRYRQGGFIQSAQDEIEEDIQELPIKNYEYY